MAKINNLHYVPFKELSNQASKQLGPINDFIKMQKEHFHKTHDIANKTTHYYSC
jgi:hypothetical protein